MFVCDPQIKIEEGERMIKEIINSIIKISSITNNTLIVVSLYHHHITTILLFLHHIYMKKSSFQDLTNVLKLQTIKKEKVNNVLDIKIRNHKNHNNDGISKNSRRRFSLPERDLLQLLTSR